VAVRYTGRPLTQSDCTRSCIHTIVGLRMITGLLETCRGFKQTKFRRNCALSCLPIRISQKVKFVVHKVPTSGHFFLLKLLLTCFRSFISCDFTHTYTGTLKSSDRSDQRVLPNFYAELRILSWPGIWLDSAHTNFSFINSTEVLKLHMT
jgi:hypothetical protein